MSCLTIRGKVIAPYSSDVVPLSTEIRADLKRLWPLRAEMTRSCAIVVRRLPLFERFSCLLKAAHKAIYLLFRGEPSGYNTDRSLVTEALLFSGQVWNNYLLSIDPIGKGF